MCHAWGTYVTSHYKNPGCSVCNKLLVGNISDILSQFIVRGNKGLLCDSTGIRFWKPVPDFPQTLPQASFPFADYVSFFFNKLQPKYNSTNWVLCILSMNYQTEGDLENSQHILFYYELWESHNRVKNTDNIIKSDLFILFLLDALIKRFNIFYFHFRTF